MALFGNDRYTNGCIENLISWTTPAHESFTLNVKTFYLRRYTLYKKFISQYAFEMVRPADV